MIDRKLVYNFTAIEDLEILKAKLTENVKKEEELKRELKEKLKKEFKKKNQEYKKSNRRRQSKKEIEDLLEEISEEELKDLEFEKRINEKKITEEISRLYYKLCKQEGILFEGKRGTM